jgi:hypothetical protein
MADDKTDECRAGGQKNELNGMTGFVWNCACLSVHFNAQIQQLQVGLAATVH